MRKLWILVTFLFCGLCKNGVETKGSRYSNTFAVQTPPDEMSPKLPRAVSNTNATSCVPNVTYSEGRVSWTFDADCSSVVDVNFTCTSTTNNSDIVSFKFIRSTTYWDIENDPLPEGLHRGTQYNCSVTSILDTGDTTQSVSLKIPPGPLTMDLTYDGFIFGTEVKWSKPFENQTVNYSVWVHRIDANHFIPPECTDDRNISQNYIVNQTNVVFDELYRSAYMYEANGSTEFWNIPVNSGTMSFQTPSAVPGLPRNLRVESYLNVDNGTQYTAYWGYPCDPNGSIKEYIVQILNNSSAIIDNTTVTSTNTSQLSLNLTTTLEEYSDYVIKVIAIGENNLTGNYSLYNFFTEDIIPPSPVLQIIEQGSTYFTMNWTMPNRANISHYLIDIHSVGPTYTRNESCQHPNSTYHYTENTTSFNFTEAWPSFIYNVSVSAVSGSTSEQSSPSPQQVVITNSSVPEAPTNFYYENQTESSVILIWNMPCNINGIISSFQINVTEAYTEDMIPTNVQLPINSSQFRTDLEVKPSHFYNITVLILLDDGTAGNPSFLNFTTEVGLPGVPSLITPQNVSNTSFEVQWEPPVEKTGPIQFYTLNINATRPLYAVPENCPDVSYSQIINTDANDVRRYIHNNSLPYYVYEVSINARTSKGAGNSTEIEVHTTQGVPENVRNFQNQSIENPLTEEYNATATISFEPPCQSYGLINNYVFEYYGTHPNFEGVNGSGNLSSFESNFTFMLKPEYEYFYYISVHNSDFENKTFGTYFRAPAGVPTFNSNDTSFIPEISSISQEQAKIRLKKEYFSSENGELRYIALILSQANLTSNNSIQYWDTVTWPTPEGGRQLTQPRWNPFLTNTEYSFTIGDGSVCNDAFCNTPLKDDSHYFLTIRVFNGNVFRDSLPIYFVTNKLSRLGTILGIIFGILFLAILGLIAFFVWKKKLYRKISHVYPRKASVKPLPPSATAIHTKKFIQYYKNALNRPEIFSEQFAELAEKSREIQSQKMTMFAALMENRRKNRYVNISPYDDTRVKLLIDEDDEIGSDYINASYIRGYSNGVEYIASQGPLLSTCRDFWKMVIQENVTIIVMVSQFVEKNKDKCYKYVPKNHENMIVGDDMEIRCLTELHFGTYLVRNLQVRKDSLQVSVTHMQFLEWPDFNVPSGTEHMLQFIYQIRERIRTDGGIITVHCSAGVGRTGTLIAADLLLQNANAGKYIDVFNTVLELRKQRVMMVQTLAQYTYLHHLVADHIDRPATPESIEATEPVYENMDMIDQSETQNASKRKEEESQF